MRTIKDGITPYNSAGNTLQNDLNNGLLCLVGCIVVLRPWVAVF